MTKSKVLTMGVVILLLCAGFAHADDDSEFWPMISLKMRINDKVDLKVLEEARIRNDMGEYYTYVQYIGPTYKVNKHLDLALWYKLVSSKKTEEEWDDSHRADLDAVVKWTIKGVKVANRTRFEYNVTADSWICRDRIKLVGKGIKLFGREYKPFVSNEFFWDIDPKDGWHENRSDAGFTTKFIMDTKLTLYYRSRLKDSSGDWKNANILGTIVSYAF